MSPRAIDVVAALLIRDGRILITRRPASSHLGGLWEFPGGKIEPGETQAQALVREMREETNCTVFPGRLYHEVTHSYPEKTVRLFFILCTLLEGEPAPMGCDAVAWVGPEGFADYAFPAADAGLLEHLIADGSIWA